MQIRKTVDYMQNLSNLSTSAQYILKTRCGYRSDDQSELAGLTHQPLPIQIIDHELNELGNTDIPDTLKLIYNRTVNTPHDMNKLIKYLLNINTDYYYLLWLCASPNDAKDYADKPSSVYDVRIPDDAIIISDLDLGGVLIASKEDPLAN